MSSLIHIFDDNKFYTRLILLILIELGNFYLLESPLNIMITAIEVVVQSSNQKIPDRKTKCVIKTHINIKQNVIFGAKLKPV